ncbi:transcriptional regulator [Opitutaceae bacterium TAV5]|nr:transcriptional regulator [Opitutaceae bacterium TAV5]
MVIISCLFSVPKKVNKPPMPAKPINPAITMRHLADAAGVSKMTVSLALRGHHKISEATRMRICNLAEKMGYRPNPFVQTLMANLRVTRPASYHSTIAWITAFPTRDGWRRHRVHRLYYEGATARAAALGYKIEEFWSLEPGMSGAALSRILRMRGIRGLVVPPVGTPGTRLDIKWEDFSCATIGYSFMTPRLHRSAANLHDAMWRALDECRLRGIRRIGFATPADTDNRVNHSWLATFLAWQKFAPAKDHLPVIHTSKPLEDMLPAWLERYRPEVIISPNTEFLNWLPALGKRVPKDIGFVTLSHPAENSSTISISGISQNDFYIGEAAVDLVVSQLQHNETGVPARPRIVLTEGSWVDGKTLPPRIPAEAAPPAAQA